MEETLLDIVRALDEVERLDDRELTKLINKHNKRIGAQGSGARFDEGSRRSPNKRHGAGRAAGATEPAPAERTGTPHPTDERTDAAHRPLSKRRLMAYYLHVKRDDPERWARWALSPEQQRRVEATLKMKPRRTASGVATVTVLTKPHPCSSDCLYCPNDLRMPKSYLADEPACQRAERVCFDPYAQVAYRLRALEEMGHVTDKVELIILGGTWSDYDPSYQVWFVRELFRALNDDAGAIPRAEARLEEYRRCGIARDPDELATHVAPLQQRVDARELTFNQACSELYASEPWTRVSSWQTATWNELEAEQRRNETARRRNVGLVVETRPELCAPTQLATLRRLGCTKVQIGIQSLDGSILAANHRRTSPAQIARAFDALRLFGFKTHVHAMVNLLGSTPEADKRDYQRLVSERAFQPDEVKLYPCVLVAGTGLCRHFADGSWRPYSEQELVDVLVADTCATPAFCRISRMIRDISAPDIVAGNKKVNLRQLVEARIDAEGLATDEIRHREVSLDEVDPASLRLETVPYETTATSERFLQWVTPDGRIAGFCRLSLPRAGAIRTCAGELPIHEGEAMIREVHVYGRVAALGMGGSAAQHRGLGTRLVERACELARDAGYERINVISAIGTRGYYRKLGFHDNGLYQQRNLRTD